MKITFWGTRGSIATPGPESVAYGGDTACVSIEGEDPSHLVVCDAGSGIRRLGVELSPEVKRIDLLLSHLHLDHIVGLGFFEPLFRPGGTIAIWGPRSNTPLVERLGRYLSPPLFPVRLRDLSCDLEMREATEEPVRVGEFTISATSVIHRDATVGYRIEAGGLAVAYLPDHEPALGPAFPSQPAWTSGASVGRDADLLIHDAQYGPDEYPDRIGWGHSSVLDTVAFAELVGARTLALFHHDPSHDDDEIARLTELARAASQRVEILSARQGASLLLEA